MCLRMEGLLNLLSRERKVVVARGGSAVKNKWCASRVGTRFRWGSVSLAEDLSRIKHGQYESDLPACLTNFS